MDKIQQFQVFAKPIGAGCNLNCQYCYYLDKKHLYPKSSKTIMDDETLEQYIVQHIEAANSETIFFSWHGGEPTLLGIEYFKKIIQFQQKHKPVSSHIINGLQTNATLLNDEWCRFFANQQFTVGVSLDGTEELHNIFRRTATNSPSFQDTMRGIELLKKHQVFFEVLCVVHHKNVDDPLGIYGFFKQIGAKYISFLPLVENNPKLGDSENVPAKKYGAFLCSIFDEWQANDIGQIKIQIIEEALRTAFDLEHSLCIFRKTCGGVPVVEHNGDFYTCDHYVNQDNLIGNIKSNSLNEMLNCPQQKLFGQAKLDTLPAYCLSCEVKAQCNGGCPKNRFIMTPDGELGLNYLCQGYKMFFNHIRTFVDEIRIANLSRSEK